MNQPPTPVTLPPSPREVGPGIWFAADGFEALDPPRPSTCEKDDEDDALVLAKDLTRQACDEGLRDGAAAVRLHRFAAEIRRDRGRPALCIENYVALTKHFLDLGRRREAVAYMRKLAFVAPASPDAGTRAEAFFLAAEVYVTVGRKRQALAAAAKGAIAAADSPCPALFGRGVELIAAIGALADEVEGRCNCGGDETYLVCCGIGDREPVEHLVRAVRPPERPPRSWNRWRPDPEGFDLLMPWPGSSRDEANWASWRSEDGRHSLAILPNWSGRALAAGRRLVALSKDDPDGTWAPSSAVLQSACALDAFINAVVFFVGRAERDRWTGANLPRHLVEHPGRYHGGPTIARWEALGAAVLGPRWEMGPRRKDFCLLMQIRSKLLHFHSTDNEEILDPTESGYPAWLADLKDRVVLRPQPRTWVDRLLTPSLAKWAVDVAEDNIAAFRAAWVERVERCERDIAVDGREYPDASWPDAFDTTGQAAFEVAPAVAPPPTPPGLSGLRPRSRAVDEIWEDEWDPVAVEREQPAGPLPATEGNRGIGPGSSDEPVEGHRRLVQPVATDVGPCVLSPVARSA